MTDSNAAAWAWVLSHASLIRGIAFKHAIRYRLNGEDLHSYLLIRCAEKWHRYDQDLGAPSTWVWNQAMAVKSLMIDQEGRNAHNEIVEDYVGDRGAASRMLVATVEAALAKKEATNDEWEAACAKAAGLSEEETRETLGIAPFSARRRVARLARRLGGSDGKR